MRKCSNLCNRSTACRVRLQTNSIFENQSIMKTIHHFTIPLLNGQTFNFESLKGKKVLLVNVASKCGLTPQYQTLQELYDTYKDKNFEIIGFPCNDFAGQEPGSAQEIQEFCTVNYGVTFPITQKIHVTGGPNTKHPIYEWLTDENLNGVASSEVSWNFQKYLINPDGTLYSMVPPQESPACDEILTWITQ